MKAWAFDTETRKTAPGCKAPPMACMTWMAEGDEKPGILHGRDPRTRALFESKIRDPETEIVGHFVAYDLGVCAAAWPDLIPDIFAAYRANRVTCTMLREKLWDIALGTYRGFADDKGVWRKNDYNLDAVARRRAGIALKKDGWRLRYGEFLDVPLEKWVEHAATLAADARRMVDAGVKDKDLEAIAKGDPIEVVVYPLEDARATLAVHLAQQAVRVACDPDPFADQCRKARDSWWENLMASWGLRTTPLGVEFLKRSTIAEIAKLETGLIAAGLVRPDGSRNLAVAKARMLATMGWEQTIEKDANGKKTYTYRKTHDEARELQKSDSGDVSLAKDACAASDDPVLIDYGDRGVLQAVLDKDVPMLEAGCFAPVHTRIDLAASGRTTSAGPNIRNLRRLPGIREAFVARTGYVYAQADYPGLELRTLAQACFDLFGHSSLGDMINRGEDPHLAFAAKVLRIPYDEAKKNKKRKDVDDARQVGKVFNFGAPGGLGTEPRPNKPVPTLIQFAKKTYNVDLTVEEIRAYKREWLETFPEMREFFAYVRRLCENPKNEATILQLRSGRIRGGCTFTAACNTWFQGLGADATQDAGFDISEACYVHRASPLFGSRIANYVYDEFILEVPERREGNTWPAATAAARELSRLMAVGANRWLPNVPFKVEQIEPVLMRVWSKDAETLEDTNGLLVPWEPALAGMIKFGEAVRKHVDRNPTLRVAA